MYCWHHVRHHDAMISLIPHASCLTSLMPSSLSSSMRTSLPWHLLDGCFEFVPHVQIQLFIQRKRFHVGKDKVDEIARDGLALMQRRLEKVIVLDGDHLLHVRVEQQAREVAGAGGELEHDLVGEIANVRVDIGGHVRVDEILDARAEAAAAGHREHAASGGAFELLYDGEGGEDKAARCC